DQIGKAQVNPGEYVQNSRQALHKSIYGLGEWREELDSAGNATLSSSPGWAGAYPWIDKKNQVYGFFLTHINPGIKGFSSFYASPVIPLFVREVISGASSNK
ncbi:MAG: serine hydrolase, partial [Bacteroidota bacterium]|nr:serine hydrolase [Bacteroidota bacterium]